MISADDKLKDLAYVKLHYVEMFFHPDSWTRAVNDTSLKWDNVDFPPSPKRIIPKSPGVYAFVVEPKMFNFSPANGLFYVGKATNLYERIGAYITDLNANYDSADTRAHIWMMLKLWNGNLKYYFVTTSSVDEAEKLEDQMIIAFRPHYNKRLDSVASREERAFG